jgi:adenylate cyclase
VSFEEEGAWLEARNGERIPIHRTCSIGRSPQSSIVLDSAKVSRRHALINAQNVGELWLIDLGSSNGTFLNRRRVHQPVRLCDMDQITIHDTTYTFRQPEQISEELRTVMAQQTIRETANVPVWLLLADIENFTRLSRSMVSERVATLVGRWVATCKEIIEGQRGEIDKYLGDGFLAYWCDEEGAAENVLGGITRLRQLQAMEPRFRVVLHHGLVSSGGLRSMGEESLIGREVIFVFRMEKLAGSLGALLMVSQAAKEKLAPLVGCEPLGAHELKGFDGQHAFYRPAVHVEPSDATVTWRDDKPGRSDH